MTIRSKVLKCSANIYFNCQSHKRNLTSNYAENFCSCWELNPGCLAHRQPLYWPLMYTNSRKNSQAYNSPHEKGEHVKFHVTEWCKADHHWSTYWGSQWRRKCDQTAQNIEQKCDQTAQNIEQKESILYRNNMQNIIQEKNLITVQQDATYSIYYISVGRSTCFGCWHPSSGACTTVITASGID